MLPDGLIGICAIWFSCGHAQVLSGTVLGNSYLRSLCRPHWRFLLGWTSPVLHLPSTYPRDLGGLNSPAWVWFIPGYQSWDKTHMTLCTRLTTHLLGTALLLNRCGRGERKGGNQKRVLLCSWWISYYLQGLHRTWCINEKHMMVYDVYRGKADGPINARAANSPKAGWF